MKYELAVEDGQVFAGGVAYDDNPAQLMFAAITWWNCALSVVRSGQRDTDPDPVLRNKMAVPEALYRRAVARALYERALETAAPEKRDDLLRLYFATRKL